MKKTTFIVLLTAAIGMTLSGCGPEKTPPVAAAKPLYIDPVFNGSTDPVLIWNKAEKQWYMFYTSRRANVPGLTGTSWVHGSPIGIATSSDGGTTWTYKCDANIPYGEPDYTFWAPDVIEHDGKYHMYLTVVPGIFETWEYDRDIVHLTSDNLVDWKPESKLILSSDRSIDANIFRVDDGWIMYYNNERDDKSIYWARSKDLYTWEDGAKVIGDRAGEGPKVFRWKDRLWMIVDNWAGLGVYSSDDAMNWTRQEGENILADRGLEGDWGVGHHADVVIGADDRAFIYYFSSPVNRENAQQSGMTRRSAAVQVAEMEYIDGKIVVDRAKPVYVDLGKR
jgi:sucrose-6-phosphate hydrolase SacC (GH32 family)